MTALGHAREMVGAVYGPESLGEGCILGGPDQTSRNVPEHPSDMAIRTSLIALALFAGACNQQEMFERLIPREDVEYSKRIVQAIQGRDFASVESVLSTTIKDAKTRAQLEQIADLFPHEFPRVVRVVNAQTSKTGDTTYVNLTLEYEFASRWVLANLLLEKRPGHNIVNGVDVEPALDSQLRLNRFSLRGKSALHYVVLGWTVMAPLFILAVMIVAIRTPMARGKWLWAIFILLGVCQVSLNWTTGQMGIEPISVALLASGFAKPGPYAPVIISTSFPLGAAVFLRKRQTLANTPPRSTSCAGATSETETGAGTTRG